MLDNKTLLVNALNTARDAYYRGNPTMTDAEYDALEDRLRTLDPNHDFFKQVGAPLPKDGSWLEVRHEIPMGSLNKAQVHADLVQWFKTSGLRPTDSLVVMDKLDGASLSIKYVNRKLAQALTRGDGITGQDITRNVLLMQGAVKMLPPTMPNGDAVGGTMPTPDVVYVRGEVICLLDDFKNHFRGESNPRSTASGTMKRQSNFEKASHLTFVAYQCRPDGQAMPTKSMELETLKYFGFTMPRYSKAKAVPSEVENIYQAYVDSIRDSLNYEIDGLVIEIDDVNQREALGESNNRPKGAIAYKFPHEAKPTILRNIRWQVGKSGRITPVAEFDTVNLVNSNVVQASLHNVSNIQALNHRRETPMFKVGDMILVSKRNDVIPYVEELLTLNETGEILSTPDQCPSCNGPLTMDGEYLVCKNIDCPAQVTGAIRRWVQKIGILHIGDALIEALVEDGYVEDIADLYTLESHENIEDLEINGRKARAAIKLAITNLNNKKTLPLHTLVGSLGIPLTGRDSAQTIVNAGYDTLSKMAKATISQIASIPGMGDIKARAFVTGLSQKLDLIAKLLENGIRIQSMSGPLSGKTFCLTGFRDPDLVLAIEQAGGTLKSSVVKNLNYLIAQDPNSNSGKMQKARKDGVNVIGIDEAWELVK